MSMELGPGGDAGEIGDAPSTDASPAAVATIEPPSYTPPSQPLAAADGYLKIVLPQPDPNPRRRARTNRLSIAMAGAAERLRAPLRWLGDLGLRRLLAPAQGRWTTVALVAALAGAILGGAGFAAAHYLAPASVAAAFCADLQAGRDDAAYARLSRALRARYTAEAFRAAARQLDAGEGRIQGCGVDVRPGAYAFDPGDFDADGASATTTLTLTRARHGSLAGPVRLTREEGAWRIDGLGAATLGLSLDAALAVDAFCQGLRDGGYSRAYAELDGEAQARQDLAAFTTQAHYYESIDGAIDACGLADVARGATALAADVTLRVTRRGTAEHRGAARLVAWEGGWRIASLRPEALGSELGPLLAGQRFCADLAQGKFADAYGLLTDAYKGQIGPGQFADDLRPDAGARWDGCAPDYSSYSVEGDHGAYRAKLITTFADGALRDDPITFAFEHRDDRWQIAALTFR